MKFRELEILEIINKELKSKIAPSKDEYERFDAYNKKFIWEIKCREKHYDQILIELDKYAFNMFYAKITNRLFIYAVVMENKIYVFNLSLLKKYNYKWGWREMPKQTEFKNNKKIKKFVGYINISDCKIVIPIS